MMKKNTSKFFPFRPLFVLLLFLGLLFYPRFSQAQNAYVSWLFGLDNPGCGMVGGPCKTIQYAVDNSVGNGDTVFIGQSIYTNPLATPATTPVVRLPEGWSLTFVGDTTGGGMPVIDGGNLWRGFQYLYNGTCPSAFPNDGVIDTMAFSFHNLIIRDCQVTSENCGGVNQSNGAGMMFTNDPGSILNIRVFNCIFNNNILADPTALNNNGRSASGAAIYVYGRVGVGVPMGDECNVLIEGCMFNGNTASQLDNGGHGGAIYLGELTSALIRNSGFCSNSVFSGNADAGDLLHDRNAGGAILIHDVNNSLPAPTVIIDSCLFSENSAMTTGGAGFPDQSEGGGIFLTRGDNLANSTNLNLIVSNSYFANNSIETGVEHIDFNSGTLDTLNPGGNIYANALVVDIGPDAVICPGDTILLDATIPGATYQWFDGFTGPVYVAGDTGIFWVDVTAGGCSIRDSVHLGLDSLHVTAFQDTALCAGDSVQLNVTIGNGGGGFLYNWNPAAGLSDPSIANPWANPSVTTTYTVTVIDTSQAGAGGNGGGVVYLRSTAGQPWGATSTEGILDAMVGVGNWLDERFETVVPANIFLPTNCLIVMEGSDFNALEMNTFIQANIGAMENWVSAGGAIFINAAPNEGGNIDCGFGGVTINYAGGPLFADVAVQGGHPIATGPIIPAGINFNGNWYAHGFLTGPGLTSVVASTGATADMVCAEKPWGSGLAMFGSMTTANWHNPAPNGENLRRNMFEYLYGLCGGGHCMGHDSVTITINPQPIADLTGLLSEYCAADDVDTLIGTPTGGIYVGPGVLGNIFDPSVADTGTHVIYYYYTDPAGCSDYDSLIVEVFPDPDSVYSGADTIICQGQCVQLNPIVAGNGVFNYVWSPAAGLNNANIANPVACPAATTTYSLTVSGGGGPTPNPTGSVIYLRSTVGRPWGIIQNETLLDNVFGAGNWSDLRYETVNVANILNAGTCLIVMEGGDNNAIELNTFLTANIAAIEAWVSGGGVVLINAAPNEGNNINLGFGGVVNNYAVGPYAPDVTALGGHPIVTGPNLPVGTNWTGGWFSHGAITGPGITSLIWDTGDPTEIVLAEKPWGAGWAMFGTMTTPNFHAPQPQANNLVMNIYEYLFGLCGIPAGCTASATITIEVAPTLDVQVIDSVDVSCAGADDGSATALASGGMQPYTYSWNTLPPQNTATATGMGPGTWWVFVTDSIGCNDSDFVTLFEPLPLALTTQGYSVSCNGLGDGSAGVHATGGTPPYAYSWNTNPVQNTDSATGLDGGMYTVMVTDSNGCVQNANVLVSEPLPISLSLASTDPNCNGANDGTGTVSATGGNGNFSYLWTPGNYTTPAINGLSPGTYVITVTDTTYGVAGVPFSLCIVQDSIIITEPPAISLSFSTQNANCGQADGFAVVYANGGVPFFSYLWNTLPAQFTDSAQGLSPGTWIVTVTDGIGCVVTDSVTIGNNAGPTASISGFSNPMCVGSQDGSATAFGAGGAGSYAFEWLTNPPQFTATATGLTAGTWQVIVTDGVNCSDTASVTLLDPPALQLQMTGYNVNCNGNNDGAATVLVTGGTPGIPPYTYLWWNTPVPQFADSVINLPPGTYSVWVTDGNGCTDSNSVTILEPPLATVTTTHTDVSCHGGNDGTASVSITNGFGPYAYLWTPGGMTTASVTGLSPGIYDVMVIDSSLGTPFGSCFHYRQVIIGEPDTILLSLTSTNTYCGQAYGTATVAASGGTGPYSYLWNTVPVQNTSTAANLIPGVYTVTVTDQQGCSVMDSVVVGDNLPPVASIIDSVDASCAGQCNGSATVQAIGGAGGYTYQWNTVPLQFTQTASGLCAGTYNVIVRDAFNCQDMVSVTINEPTPVSLSFTSTDNTCFGGNTGSATVTASGGTPPYSYFWSTIPTQTNPTATNLAEGLYWVSVLDFNGCEIMDSVYVDGPDEIVVQVATTEPSCNGGNNATATVSVSGGIPPFGYQWLPGGQVVPNPGNLTAGTHTLIVSDSNGCTDTTIVTISEPTLLSLTGTTTPERCFVTGDDGTATVIPVGGTPPYSYSWNSNPVQITQVATGLGPGNYVCTVTDFMGCTAQISLIVAEIPGPSVAIANPGVFCEGEGGDTLLAIPSGGTAPYYFYWWCDTLTSPNCGLDSVFDNDPVVNPDGTTTYYVQVTDANGCVSGVDSIVVTVMPKPLVQVGDDFVMCADSAPCELLSASVSGAPGPFIYQWSPATGLSNPGILTPCARPDSTTIYTLVVTSSNGCNSLSPTVDSNSSVVVSVVPMVHADAGGDKDICLGETVMLNGIGTGSGPDYSFQWSPGTGLSNDTIPNPIASPGSTTSYVLNVLSNGCTSYGDTLTVFVHAIPSAGITLPSDICQGDTVQLDGQAWGDPFTGFYTYSWMPDSLVVSSPFDENPLVAPYTTTTFYLTVATEFGCEAMDSAEVTVKPSPIADAGNDFLICEGENVQLSGAYYFFLTDSVTNPALISHFWSPVIGLSNPNAWDPTADPVTSTLYTLTVGYNNCFSEDEVLVNVAPGVTASISADTNKFCEGDSVQLIGMGGLGGASFEWSPQIGLDNPDTLSPWASPSQSQTYTLVVSEGHCADTDEITLTVFPSPVASFVHSFTSGCAPFTVDFIENGVGGVAWSWDFGDGGVANTPNAQHTFMVAGQYPVTLTSINPGGCESTASEIVISVGDSLAAEFHSNPDWPLSMSLPGSSVRFFDQSTGPVSNWIWDFGDGNTSDDPNPDHHWFKEGVYYVTLTVTDDFGCVGEVVHGPYEIRPSDLWIPNVLTPNGDGVTETFKVEYSGNQPYLLQIFDRWGNRLFETRDKYEGWDGLNHGQLGGAEMPAGVYFYTLRIGEKDYSGNLTLLR